MLHKHSTTDVICVYIIYSTIHKANFSEFLAF